MTLTHNNPLKVSLLSEKRVRVQSTGWHKFRGNVTRKQCHLGYQLLSLRLLTVARLLPGFLPADRLRCH